MALKERIRSIDIFSGQCLVVMTVGHVGSPLRGYVYEALGYISAVAEVVYTKYLDRGTREL